jgi:hypothetical protein
MGPQAWAIYGVSRFRLHCVALTVSHCFEDCSTAATVSTRVPIIFARCESAQPWGVIVPCVALIVLEESVLSKSIFTPVPASQPVSLHDLAMSELILLKS